MAFQKGWKGGPGRPKNSVNGHTTKVRAIALKLLSSPKYIRQLQQDLETRTLEASLEALLWHYAYGKPKDHVEVSHDLSRLSEPELLSLELVLQKVS